VAEGARGTVPESVVMRIDTGVRVPDEPRPLSVAVEMFLPTAPAKAPAALFCLSGGNMNRHYWNLQSEGDDSFSFARQMAQRGFIVITLDYPGLGESDQPADGYALTTDVLVQVCARVREVLVEWLHTGRLPSAVIPAPDYSTRGQAAAGIQFSPLPTLKTIGIGHSMGAMLTVVQQATHPQHAAIALLGFSTRGLPEYLPAAARAMDTATARAQVVELAKKTFVVPYPVIRGGGNTQLYGSESVDPRGVQAIKRASEHILPVPAFQSMLPGNVAAEAAQIEVPLFLGIGERDMVGPPQDVPAAFPKARGVHLQVLPQTGHSHFLFASRVQLFDGLAQWVRDVSRS